MGHRLGRERVRWNHAYATYTPLHVRYECRYDPGMGSQPIQQAKPVFVVGSPRSGTSILTWALGQHPNLLLTEESNWLGSFAIGAAAAHALGSARALRSQLSALCITRADFLSGLGNAVDRMIVGGRAHLEAASYATAVRSPEQANPEFAISRHPCDTKSRWVDGTPEYSLQIPMLLALFPNAQFVHILRNADEVAASLLAFRSEMGRPIVGSAEEAYAYWLRTAQACVNAEDILGPKVVHRVRYADLVGNGESALRGTLDFLAEPFAPACLEPLKRRINSSFTGETMPRVYPDAQSKIIEQARRASEKWLTSSQSTQADNAARAGWQADLNMRVLHAQSLQANWEAAQRMLSQSRLAFGVCGILLLLNGLVALAFWLRSGDTAGAPWLALACAMVAVYLWMRRSGLRAIMARVLGAITRLMSKRG